MPPMFTPGYDGDPTELAALQRAAESLEKFVGLKLCIDTDPILDAADLAAHIEVAAMNYAAGRKKAYERDDDGLDPNPQRIEPVYGP